MRYRKIFTVLLAMVFLCATAFASVGVKEEGSMLGAATDLNFVGVGITASGAYGVKTITLSGNAAEEAATPDTITVAESGSVFVATGTATGSRSFELPSITSANDGVTFTFITGAAEGGATPPDMNIEPQDDATIFVDSTQSDGESITGAYSDSYPTIKLVAFGGNWYVAEAKAPAGTWINGG